MEQEVEEEEEDECFVFRLRGQASCSRSVVCHREHAGDC